MAASVEWRRSVAAACLLWAVATVSGSQTIIRKLTMGFSTVLEECKNELNVADHVMKDFYNFWREDYELVNRDMGCIIICMAHKFNLVGDDLTLHHGNAQDFAKKHGADDEMASQLVGIIHACEQEHAAVVDDCSRTLEMAKCFRTRIHSLKWAPSMEEVLEEVMTEV